MSTNAVACQKATVYTVTWTFSEAVQWIEKNDLSVTNGDIQSFDVVSDKVAVWTVKADVSGNGTVTVWFEENKVTDIAWNGNTAAKNLTWTYDNSAPNVPNMILESAYTKSTNNTVYSEAVSDNGCNSTVQYQFCKSTTNNTSNCSGNNISSWLSTTEYTFNKLSDGTKYYYFVRIWRFMSH